MLKGKVTKKELTEGYYNIISIGYCRAEYLLKYKTPRFYYSNIYGWRFDVYEIDYSTILTTGYAYLKTHKKQSKINEIIEKYDNKAKNIIQNYNYKTINKRLDNNFNKCIKELKEILNNEN